MSRERKTISHDDYLRLEGLLVLARDHNRALKDVERSVAAIVGEDDSQVEDYYGLASDAVYDGQMTGADLVRNMGISIEERQPE